MDSGRRGGPHRGERAAGPAPSPGKKLLEQSRGEGGMVTQPTCPATALPSRALPGPLRPAGLSPLASPLSPLLSRVRHGQSWWLQKPPWEQGRQPWVAGATRGSPCPGWCHQLCDSVMPQCHPSPSPAQLPAELPYVLLGPRQAVMTHHDPDATLEGSICTLALLGLPLPSFCPQVWGSPPSSVGDVLQGTRICGFYCHLGAGARGSSQRHGALAFVPLTALQDPCVKEGSGLVGLGGLRKTPQQGSGLGSTGILWVFSSSPCQKSLLAPSAQAAALTEADAACWR